MPPLDLLKLPCPPEVPLARAPLVRVLAQVRFPPVLSISRTEAMVPFQDAISRDYPVLRPTITRGITIDPSGIKLDSDQTIWRFAQPSGTGWSVSLAPNYVALETQQYTSRDDFIGRLKTVLDALKATFNPAGVDRLGVRYIDRILGSHVDDISKFVRPEMLGVTGITSPLIYAVTDALFSGEGPALRARWGRLQADATIDPAAVEPVKEHSWILDLDMYTQQSTDFNTERVAEQARLFAERIYTFFRWVVTDDFLRYYGGQP